MGIRKEAGDANTQPKNNPGRAAQNPTCRGKERKGTLNQHRHIGKKRGKNRLVERVGLSGHLGNVTTTGGVSRSKSKQRGDEKE